MLCMRFVLALGLLVAVAPLVLAQPASHVIGNHSFELPALTDSSVNTGAGFPQQGGYGWLFSFTGTSSGMYNPPVNTYSTAGGNGTPFGAHGSQVGWSLFGGISQLLAGPDQIPNNGDDPLLESSTTYVLTVSIGFRLPGNQYGNDLFGGYAIRLYAGTTVIAQEVNAMTPPVGTFVDRTVVVNSEVLDPALHGQRLSIELFAAGSNGGVTDFDQVRLVSINSVPEPATLLWLAAVVTVATGSVVFRRRRIRRRPVAL